MDRNKRTGLKNKSGIRDIVEQALSGQLYTKKELTEKLKIGGRTLDRWIRNYHIKTIRMGGRVLIPFDQLEHFFSVEQEDDNAFNEMIDKIYGGQNGND